MHLRSKQAAANQSKRCLPVPRSFQSVARLCNGAASRPCEVVSLRSRSAAAAILPRRSSLAASSSGETATTTAVVGLEELQQDTFWPYLEAAGSSLVVVDFFTDWCGPCKVIYPELVKLSQEMTDVKFVKLNCNKANKQLGVQLGIKVAPTFHIYHRSNKVAEMTGAKVDKLIDLIKQAQTTAAAPPA